MAFPVDKKVFCVLEFAKTESIMTVQRKFRIVYDTEPPTDKTIRDWYMKFQQSGCLCTPKRTGRPGPSAETVERVREAFVKSPQKSTTRASRELQMSQSSVWRILRKRLRVKGCDEELSENKNIAVATVNAESSVLGSGVVDEMPVKVASADTKKARAQGLQ